MSKKKLARRSAASRTRSTVNKYAGLIHGRAVEQGGAEEKSVQLLFDVLKLNIKEQDDTEIADYLARSVEIANDSGLSWTYKSALLDCIASFPPEARGVGLSLPELTAALITLSLD